MIRVGDGLGVGPDLDAAVSDAIEAAMRPLSGLRPDLVIAFVAATGPQADSALQAIRDRCRGRVTLGATVSGAIGAGQAAEEGISVSIWAAVLPQVSIRPFHLEVIKTPERTNIVGEPRHLADDVAAVLIADPWSFPADPFRGPAVNSVFTRTPVIGGFASGSAPGQTTLMVDEWIHDRGAVGVVIGGPIHLRSAIAQGARPIGQPLVITEAVGPEIHELAGQPALIRAQEAVASLPEEEQALAVRGLYLGLASSTRGDFVIHAIRGADEAAGALAIDAVATVGDVVQFHLRDADAASDQLAESLRGLRGDVRGVLLFDCLSRGRAMFTSPSADATAVREGLGTEGVAGFFAAGEFAPSAGGNRVHLLTACLLAFYGTGEPGLREVPARAAGADPAIGEIPDDISSLSQ